MVALHAKGRALSRLQIAVPADVARGYRIAGGTQTHIPATGYLRCFAKQQINIPGTHCTATVIRYRHIQLIAAAPDIRFAHFASNTTATRR